MGRVNERWVYGNRVVGVEVGLRTECAHYASELDIIAIRFRCCDTYYPCHACHEALAGHAVQTWPKGEFDQLAVLCGACGNRLSVAEYFECGSKCPSCGSAFNPGCAGHYSLYFDV
jgi:uncharacterized CHY-type Zn-finger protein